MKRTCVFVGSFRFRIVRAKNELGQRYNVVSLIRDTMYLMIRSEDDGFEVGRKAKNDADEGREMVQNSG